VEGPQMVLPNSNPRHQRAAERRASRNAADCRGLYLVNLCNWCFRPARCASCFQRHHHCCDSRQKRGM